MTNRYYDSKKTGPDQAKKLEAQLLQAHKMESIGTLTVEIANDFNNILTSVIAFTELTMMSVKKNLPSTRI